MQRNSSSNPYGRPRKARPSRLPGHVFDNSEIAAFLAQHGERLKSSSRLELSEACRQDDLIMIRPGNFDNVQVSSEPAFIDTLTPPRAPHSYASPIPLHRVSDETLVKRRADEVRTMAALRQPGPWQIGEASHLRQLRAIAAGSTVADEAIEIEEETPAGVIRSAKKAKRVIGQRKRIISRLEVLHTQGKLDSDMMAAARIFQASTAKSFDASTGLVAKYGGADATGHRELLPTEYVAEHGRQVSLIRAMFDWKHQAVLHWIGREAYRDVSLEMLGEHVSPWLTSRKHRCLHAIKAICYVLAHLAQYYGLRQTAAICRTA